MTDSNDILDDQIDEIFSEFENSGPPFAAVEYKWQYEAIRDYLKPELKALLTNEADRGGLDKSSDSASVGGNQVANRSVYVTPAKMLKWVEAYPSISKRNETIWPGYTDLLACFKRLVESKNVGHILRLNYNGLHEKDGEWWYQGSDLRLDDPETKERS